MRMPADPEIMEYLNGLRYNMVQDDIRSSCNNILTFGIFQEVTGDIKTQLVNELHDSHVGFILNFHLGIVCSDEDCFIFNITLETMIYLAARHQIGEFYFCDVRSESEWWRHPYEKQQPDEPANKSKNPYVVKDRYSYLNIPVERFKKVNAQLSENLKQFDNDPEIIERTMHQVGQYPWYVRQKLYRGLF